MGTSVNRNLGKYTFDSTLGTESQYGVAGTRIVWKPGTPGASFDPKHRIVYTHRNLLGSTTATQDLRSGAVLEETTFYSNGARETLRTTSSASFATETTGFTGKEEDEESGLVYFGQRYLIAHVGRWASPDPLAVHAMGGGEAMNAYHYVAGNLLQARDPVGLQGGRPQAGGEPMSVNPITGEEARPANARMPNAEVTGAEGNARTGSCGSKCDQVDFTRPPTTGDPSYDPRLVATVRGAQEVVALPTGSTGVSDNTRLVSGGCTTCGPLSRTADQALAAVVTVGAAVSVVSMVRGLWHLAKAAVSQVTERLAANAQMRLVAAEMEALAARPNLGNFASRLSAPGLAPGADASVGTGGLRIDDGSIVREIAHGEKIDDLISEVAGRTYELSREQAIVSLNNGTRVIIEGGEEGIRLGAFDIRRVLLHTHPYTTGPSLADRAMLGAYGQRSSWVYELFGGGLSRFRR